MNHERGAIQDVFRPLNTNIEHFSMFWDRTIQSFSSFDAMDSLSQLVLGAATAEAVMGRKAGNRAILWGAIGGTIPDLDVLCRPFVDVVTGMDWHRGFSHSLLFFVLFAPMLGWLISKVHKGKWGSPGQWAWAMFLTFFTHALLDCFTTWGTQLFYPLDTRVAWHTVFVADPLYTVPFLIAVVWVLTVRRTKPRRQWVNWIGLALSSGYLALTAIHKGIADDAFEARFAASDMNIEYWESRPTPLNTILWMVQAKSGDGYYVGYYSILDRQAPEDIELFYVQQTKELLAPFNNNEKLERLKFLSQGYYCAREKEDGTIQFVDLRFGQPKEISPTGEGFVFGFDLVPNEDGTLTITQSTESEPDPEVAKAGIAQLWERIQGI